MTRPYRQYTDKDIVQYASEVYSLAGLLKKLGLRATGGNYVNMKKNLQRLKLQCSHWRGKAWNRGQRTKDWSQFIKNKSIKPHIIQLRGHKCEHCTNTHWLNKPIPLELHHINGDSTSNELDNLMLLCPNCHAFTDTYRGKNIK